MYQDTVLLTNDNPEEWIQEISHPLAVVKLQAHNRWRPSKTNSMDFTRLCFSETLENISPIDSKSVRINQQKKILSLLQNNIFLSVC